MASVSKTLLDAVREVSLRVGNFKAYVESVENPDPNMRNMVECVNEVIRKMCRAKPSPMLHSTFTTGTKDDYTSDSYEITAISSGGVVTGASGVVWDTNFGPVDSSDGIESNNVILAITDNVGSADMRLIPFRVSDIASETQLTLSDYTGFGSVGSVSYSFIMTKDRYTMPGDFSSLISVSVQGTTLGETALLEQKKWSEIEYIRHTIRGRETDSYPYTTGMPRYVTVVEEESLYRLQLDPCPDKTYGIYVKYIRTHKRVSSDSDYILISDNDFDVLVSGVVALWSSFTIDGNESAYMNWLSVLKKWAESDYRPTDARKPVTEGLEPSGEFSRSLRL